MKILVIQTAYLGDVVLATGIVEKLHHTYPAAKIDFLLRKGNEGMLKDHPYLHEVLIWDKEKNKYGNLLRTISKVREAKYEYVVNVQRFATSGLITGFSGSRNRFGFDKNPLSFLFTRKLPHIVGNYKHDLERNHSLIATITDEHFAKYRIYPSKADYAAVERYKVGSDAKTRRPYVCIAPTSIWFTKEFPKDKWMQLIDSIPEPEMPVYLLGGPADHAACEVIRNGCKRSSVINLAGKLSLLESASMQIDARMNYVNDSAPMHMCGALNAPVTAIFCSTAPLYGFVPLSDTVRIVETKEKLSCRPCGLHGHKACPEKHFKCALTIRVEDIPLLT
jgi:ADP-heptose:LPS heptosyltransferase